jgi:hypothetical protein
VTLLGTHPGYTQLHPNHYCTGTFTSHRPELPNA